MLVIPTNTPINLQLASEGGGAHDDSNNPDHMVIHSFWAPRLFGKQDVVPGNAGEDNHIVFSAWEPGTYFGQCAEFCGLQHGMMKFRIVALDAPDWQAWVANHKQPALTPQSGTARGAGDGSVHGAARTARAAGASRATRSAGPEPRRPPVRT